LRQVTGDLGLAFAKGAGQLTNAEFLLSRDQQHQAYAGIVSQTFEDAGRGQVCCHCGSQCSFHLVVALITRPGSFSVQVDEVYALDGVYFVD
jgi:hypothetical protein